MRPVLRLFPKPKEVELTTEKVFKKLDTLEFG